MCFELVCDDEKYWNMFVYQKFNSNNDAVFCGVFDGHGPYGHVVARKVRDSLPVLLSTQLMENTNIDLNSDTVNNEANGNTHEEELLEEYWCEQSDNDEKQAIPEKYVPLKKSILKSFKLIDKELKTHPLIDCFCSGTTAVTLIKQVSIFSNRLKLVDTDFVSCNLFL